MTGTLNEIITIYFQNRYFRCGWWTPGSVLVYPALLTNVLYTLVYTRSTHSKWRQCSSRQGVDFPFHVPMLTPQLTSVKYTFLSIKHCRPLVHETVVPVNRRLQYHHDATDRNYAIYCILPVRCLASDSSKFVAVLTLLSHYIPPLLRSPTCLFSL